MVMLTVGVGVMASTITWSQRPHPERQIAWRLGPQLQASGWFGAPGVMQTPDERSMGWPMGEDHPIATELIDAGVRAALPPGATSSMGLLAGVTVFGPELQVFAQAVQVDLLVPEIVAALPLVEGLLPDASEVAVSRAVADQLGVGIGDIISARMRDWNSISAEMPNLGAMTISGILAEPRWQRAEVLFGAAGPLTVPDYLVDRWVPDEASVNWFIGGDTPITWADVQALNEVGLVMFSRDVVLNPPPDSEVPLLANQPRATFGEWLDVYGMAVAVVAVMLLEVVLLIGPSFAVGARRQARSLALIAASGGTPQMLRAVVMGAGMITGALGSMLGVVLGLAVAAVMLAAMNHSSLDQFSIPWHLVALIAAAGVLLTIAAAWLPARGASRVDVVATLAGRRGDTSSRRWLTVIGAVLAVGGYTLALIGAISGWILALIAGVIAGQIGLVFACGGIVALLGRLARSLSLSWRLALRDAARNRSRTVPAVVAVLVAAAGAAAGLLYIDANEMHNYRSRGILATDGTLIITAPTWSDRSVELTSANIAEIERIVADVAPRVGELLPVSVLAPLQTGEVTTVTSLLFPPEHHGWFSGDRIIFNTIVDDGTLVDILGLPAPEAARAALAAGQVVTPAGVTFADGRVRFVIEQQVPGGASEPGLAEGVPVDDLFVTAEWVPPITIASREVALPAVEMGDARGPHIGSLPIIPPSVASELGGQVVVGALVSAEPLFLSFAEQQTLYARLTEHFGVDEWGSGLLQLRQGGDHYRGDYSALISTIIVGAAAVMALAAAWIAAALAATESRPDLTTLSAVGASPSTRKRIVAAQAGTIVVIGTVIGTASGIALGSAFVLNNRYGPEWGPVISWSVSIPWLPLAALVIGLPLIALAAAWLVTRSRETLTHRRAA